MHHPVANRRRVLTPFLILLSLVTAACSDPTTDTETAAASADFESRKAAMLAHMQNHFDSKFSFPPEIVEAVERGELSQEEVDARAASGEFEKFFHDDANKVLEALGARVDLTLAAVDAFVASMVSFANHTDQQWPFVTLPDFYLRASKIQALSKAVYMTVYTLVTEENRNAWENYTSHNNGWVNESVRMQDMDPRYTGPIIYNFTSFDVIHGDDEYYKENPGIDGTNRTGPYLPNWQSSPVVARYPPYNWNLLQSLNPTSILEVFTTKKVVISQAYMIPDFNDPEQLAETELWADWFSDFIDPGEEPMEPGMFSDFLGGKMNTPA